MPVSGLGEKAVCLIQLRSGCRRGQGSRSVTWDPLLTVTHVPWGAGRCSLNRAQETEGNGEGCYVRQV